MKLEEEVQFMPTLGSLITMSQPAVTPLEEITLEQAVSRIKPASQGVTRFHHRIPFGDITIYANDIPDADFKKMVATEEELQEKAKALSNKEKSLGLEWAKLDEEQSGGERVEDGLEINNPCALQIETRKAETEQEIKNLRKKHLPSMSNSLFPRRTMLRGDTVTI
jgi:hypothetical protein